MQSNEPAGFFPGGFVFYFYFYFLNDIDNQYQWWYYLINGNENQYHLEGDDEYDTG